MAIFSKLTVEVAPLWTSGGEAGVPASRWAGDPTEAGTAASALGDMADFGVVANVVGAEAAGDFAGD